MELLGYHKLQIGDTVPLNFEHLMIDKFEAALLKSDSCEILESAHLMVIDVSGKIQLIK